MLEVLYAESYLLTAAEQDQLGIAIVNALAVARLPQIPADFARNLLSVVDHGIEFFQNQKFLRGRDVSLPWEEREPKRSHSK